MNIFSDIGYIFTQVFSDVHHSQNRIKQNYEKAMN